jgi:hypothetical protein
MDDRYVALSSGTARGVGGGTMLDVLRRPVGALLRAGRRSRPVEPSRRYGELLAHGQVRPLDAQQLRTIADYARDVLGAPIMARELQLFTAIRGEFRPGWITEKYFGIRVLPNISTEVGRGIGPARTLMTSLLGADGVPELGRRIAGQWYDDAGLVTTRNAVAESGSSRGPDVVVKTDGSRQSQGVRVIGVDELRASEPSPGADLVVQHLIRPHPALAILSPGSTPPLRLLTVLRDGEPELMAAHVRLGVGSVRVAGGPESIRVPVASEGTMHGIGADRTLRLHEEHPATRQVFAGTPIPSFDLAVARCRAWHRRLPHAGAIGWDVAIDPEGTVHLMEMNTLHPGIFFHEALAGPNFAELGWERFSRVSASGSAA